MPATPFGCEEPVRFLLEAGADNTPADRRGLTARHLAGQQGNENGEAGGRELIFPGN